MKKMPFNKFAAALRETRRNFQPLWIYFARNRTALAIGVLSLLVVDFLQLMVPLVIKNAINLLVLTTSRTAYLLLKQGVLIALIALCIAVFRYVWRLLLMGHSRKVEQGLRNRLYRHIQTLSMSFFQNTSTGDIMARAINDINAVRMACGMGLVALVDGFVLGAAAVGFMMRIDWRLTLISLVPAPIVVVATRILANQMSARFERVQTSFSSLTELTREAFAGIRVLKAHQREKWEYGRMTDGGRRYVAESMRLAKTLAFFFPLMTLTTNAGLAVVILVGGRYTILGTITPGDFVAFISYLNLLTWPMMAMGWVTSLIQRGSASMRRINHVLNTVPEIADTKALPNDSPLRCQARLKKGAKPCTIAFEGVYFQYPDRENPVLSDVNLAVLRGETVAVVGRVGSGKTTLLRAIPRLIDVSRGSVFLNDRDVRELSLEELRSGIGFVCQDVFVFSDTVFNNVAFGREDISRTDVCDALTAAGIRSEIEALEKGLDTLLGERGVTLSGGQRQRLTIARAIAVNFPVLILDDALSMVDTRTEERILNQILNLRRRQTHVIVSHRVSTIRRADRIVVMDGGQIKETGRHETLMAKGGIYRALYEEQLLGESISGGDAP